MRGLIAIFSCLIAVPATAVDVPLKAKQVKGEFVTAYDPCILNAQNQTTNPPVVLAACPATRSDSVCGFGPKGSGKYSGQVSGSDIKVKAALKGLAGCDGAALVMVQDAVVTTTDCTVDASCT